MASATTVTTTLAGNASVPKRNSAARIFGYDVFISFALGMPPRGTYSYASGLARRLRDRDFTVFFSEDEASPGERLDSTLFRALVRSRTLVVIANRGTLKEPRWVRTEVEEFRSRHPDRPVIPINVDGALQDTTLAEHTQEWLAFQNTIWLDESQDAVTQGIAYEELVTRLAMAPAGLSSNAKWRWLVRAVAAALIVLAVGASGFGYYALKQSREAKREQGIAETNAAEAKRQQGVAEKNGAEAKRQQGFAEKNAAEARNEAATLAAANLALQRSHEKERSALANGLLAFPGPGNSLRKAGWKNANDLGLRGAGVLRPGVRVGLVAKDAPAGTLCCVVEDESGKLYLLAIAPVWPWRSGASVSYPGLTDDAATKTIVVGRLARRGRNGIRSGVLAELSEGVEWSNLVPEFNSPLILAKGTSDVGAPPVMPLNIIGSGSGLILAHVSSLTDDEIQIYTPERSLFSDAGDEGALVLDFHRQLIGLVWGGGGKEAFAIPIQKVFSELGVHLANPP